MADEITQALKQFRARAEGYRLFRAYYDGDHRLAFATEKFRSAFGSLFQVFADNVCAAIVDVTVDRLEVTGFDVAEGPDEAGVRAWQLWESLRLARRAREVHSEAFICGDAYAIVWPDAEGVPTVYPNEAAQVVVGYDEETPGRVLWAAKAWVLSDGRARLNMYWPNRIEKYATSSGTASLPESSAGLILFEVEGEPWPLRNPYGVVPVVHFANNGRIGRTGRSELHDVVPLQDALNKALADMLVAMEYVALPQRWATGLEVDIDPMTGEVRPPFVPGADRIWALGDPEARFGQFAQANLGQFLEVQGQLRTEIAAVSRTPQHYMIPAGGQWPSGEALRSAESAFLAKVVDRQMVFGDAWEDVMRLVLLMSGGPEAVLRCQWHDPTPRGAMEQAQVGLMKRQLGVSRRQALSELGYAPDVIDRMEAEAEEEQEQQDILTSRAWYRGRLPTSGDEA